MSAAKVRGFTRKLARGGSVSVGRADGCTDTFLKFVNTDGDETRVRLSEQAVEALRGLLTRRPRDMEWQLVESGWERAP